jgi:uncharacterized membrane protein
MSKRTYTVCTIAIVAILGAVIGWSTSVGNAVLPIVAALAAIGLLHLCRKRVKEVIQDERLHKINEKASQITFRISTIIMAVTGAVFIALSKSASADLRQAGLTLAYTVCALVVLNLALYTYYSQKY